MKIQIKHRNVYGNDLMYVCDPDTARMISQLTGCRTVSVNDVHALKDMGHEVEDLDQTIKEMIAK